MKSTVRHAALTRLALCRIALIAIACCGVAGTRPAAAADSAAEPSLVVLGDSISAGYGIPLASGWVALLGARLKTTGYGYRVVNASVSGETTAGALARLAHVLDLHKPAVVLIELGGNDGLRGLPIAQTKANLDRITAQIQDSGSTPVIIGMRIPTNYGPVYTQQFADLYAQVAHARHVALVPFLLARVADDDANFQADRIHPIATVQPQLLDTVWPVLEPVLRQQRKSASAR